MDETKVQIGDDVLLDIGIHSDWYISVICYNNESVNVELRRKTDRNNKWWVAEQTENSSEKSNNCETCKYGEDKHRYAHICNECGVGINNYEPKDKSTISKMEQVDKLQTKDYCDICNHKGCEYCISDSRNPYCIPSNYEPRTEGDE